MCNLYNWRYKKLGNLQHVHNWPEYCTANPGFFFDFQLINVEDFNGVGESEPNPYFYQVRVNILTVRVRESNTSALTLTLLVVYYKLYLMHLLFETCIL